MGWSSKYKKSIDCKNPKGFSQKAHCQGKKKMNEQMTQQNKAEYMAQRLLNKARGVAAKYDAAKKAAKDVKTTSGSVTIPEETCPVCAFDPCQCLESTITEKRDGKSSKDPGYSLRDWFKGGGWVQAGGKYDGKPCAKQPGQKTKPFCRDADDRAAMSKIERNKRAAKKRKEDPNPDRKGKAKNVKQESFSNWRADLEQLDEMGLANAIRVGGAVGAAIGGGVLVNKAKESAQRLRNAADKRMGKPPTYQKNSYQPEGENIQEFGGLIDRVKSAGRKVAVKTGERVGERIGKEKAGPIGGMIGKGRGGKTGGKAYDQATSGNVGGAVNTIRDALSNSYEPEGGLVDEGKKDACYHKVKSRYSVWPSAYASGALVKCRKKGAANWGNSKKTRKESFEFSNWRDDFQPTEYEFIDIIKTTPMKGLAEAKTKDHEHQMARSEISKIVSAAGRLKKKVKGEGNLKAWVQSKITRAADYIDTAADYMDGHEGSDTHESVNEKCWDGYVQKGLKKKGKRMVPNCVKEFSDWRSDIEEGAAWTRKEGKNKSGGLNEKGRKSYERENHGSDLKAPSKKVGNPRRKSFCARMKGMKAKLTSKKTASDPDSRINKSLRAWNC